MVFIAFTVNGTKQRVDVSPETPLLWVLRDTLELTGTKYGCGIGACGSCTVHLDGEAARSCSIPIASCEGKSVTTIEGLSPDLSHPVQRAWLEVDVPQCGYCQPGMIMSSAALLKQQQNPSDADIDREMTNLCRCGTYNRVRKAIHLAAKKGGAR